MKGTKLCWSAYLALLVAEYSSAATPGVVSAPALVCRLVPGHTTPTSSTHVVPSLCTLMSPRLWSAAPCGFSILGSIVAWTWGNRRSSLHSASRMLSWRYMTRLHRRLQNRPCSGSSANDPAARSSPLASAALSANSLWRGPACAEQLHLHCASGMAQGTPMRRRRMWRNRSSGIWARVLGGVWTTTPEFAHDDERTWAARSLLYWCSLARISRSVCECRMRSAVLALSIAWITAWGRVLAVMSGSPLMSSARTLATGTLPSTCPRRAGVAMTSSLCAGAGSAAAVMVMTGSLSTPHCPRTIAALSRNSCLWKKRAMLSRQR